MQFIEQTKCGTVMGNPVKASPVPFSRLRKVEAAQGSEDATAVVDEMCGIIKDFVTMDDGTPIDPEALSSDGIKALFSFATGLGGDVADFT